MFLALDRLIIALVATLAVVFWLLLAFVLFFGEKSSMLSVCISFFFKGLSGLKLSSDFWSSTTGPFPVILTPSGGRILLATNVELCLLVFCNYYLVLGDVDVYSLTVADVRTIDDRLPLLNCCTSCMRFDFK